MSDTSIISKAIQATAIARSKFFAETTVVSSESLFGDSVWKMGSLTRLPGISSKDLEWDYSAVPGFPNGFALALAEYAYARLYKPVDSTSHNAAWLTVRNELYSLKALSIFCEKSNFTSFDQIDTDVFAQYLKTITYVDKKSSDRVRQIFSHIYKFWEFRSTISQPIKLPPFEKPFKDIFSYTRNKDENKTPVIPEYIYKPLMANALEYINNYAHSILDALDNSRLAYLEAEKLGKSKRQIQKYLLSKTKKYLKYNQIHDFRRTPCKGIKDLYNEVNSLRTACVLIVLAYSGIRASELLSLQADCCHVGIGADGLNRHYIDATLYKHRGNGTLDRWVVIEEVHKAIKLIERITKCIRNETGDNRLFITDGSCSFLSVNHDYTNSVLSILTFEAIVYQINRFRYHCNLELNCPPIPDHIDEHGDLVPWKFNCRQFRRTLARYIARQPFGVIAGMLQYKHIQVALFEGYAGSEPEWNKMLSDEKVLSNVDILSELSLDLAQGAVSGEFGIKLKAEFENEFKGRSEDFSPSQIAKWLANSNKELFVGKFNFCFFDPTKALCISPTKTDMKPNLNFCSPDQCSNACISKRHSPLWRAQLAQAEQFVEHPKASEYQRQALAGEIHHIRSILDSIGENEID